MTEDTLQARAFLLNAYLGDCYTDAHGETRIVPKATEGFVREYVSNLTDDEVLDGGRGPGGELSDEWVRKGFEMERKELIASA